MPYIISKRYRHKEWPYDLWNVDETEKTYPTERIALEALANAREIEERLNAKRKYDLVDMWIIPTGKSTRSQQLQEMQSMSIEMLKWNIAQLEKDDTEGLPMDLDVRLQRLEAAKKQLEAVEGYKNIYEAMRRSVDVIDLLATDIRRIMEMEVEPDEIQENYGIHNRLLHEAYNDLAMVEITSSKLRESGDNDAVNQAQAMIGAGFEAIEALMVMLDSYMLRITVEEAKMLRDHRRDLHAIADTLSPMEKDVTDGQPAVPGGIGVLTTS